MINWNKKIIEKIAKGFVINCKNTESIINLIENTIIPTQDEPDRYLYKQVLDYILKR